MLQLPQVGLDWTNFTILLLGSAGASSSGNIVNNPRVSVSLNGGMPEAALTQNPFDEKADLKLATMAYNDGDLKQAYKLYARAVELQPDNPEANFELGKMLAAKGQFENVRKLIGHAVQIDPTNEVIHYRLSNVYRGLGRTKDAKREVQLFQKSKDPKETLRTIYRELHLDAQRFDVDESAHSQ